MNSFKNFGLALVLLPASFAVSAAVPFTSARLGDLLFHPEQSAPATVESLNASRLSAEITARIEGIPVRIGDRVEKGTLLVRLDCRDYHSRLTAEQASSRRLESQKRLAIQQLKRARSLRSERNIPEEQVEQREMELASVQAELQSQAEVIRQADLRLERCDIRSPFLGVVEERIGQVGELANPGTPLIGLRQLDALEVKAALRPEQDPGPAPHIWFDYHSRLYPLSLRRLLPVMDPVTRTRQARFEFVDEAAPSGAAGRVVWTPGLGHIPADLLVRRDDRLGVLILDRGKARFHELPGALEGQPAGIDLPPDTLVIIDGRQRLKDGDDVQPAD